MNNNIVFLSGWLELTGKPSVHLSNMPTLSGWLHTDDPSAGGRHPVILLGPTAEKAKVWQRTLGKCFFAVVQGKLHSALDGQHSVIARFVRPFDAPYPACSDGDASSSNVVFISGWMKRVTPKLESIMLGGLDTPVVRTWLYTDRDDAGGKHPITLAGRQAEIALEWGRSGSGAVQKGYTVIIEGRLFSFVSEYRVHGDRIYPLSTGPRAPISEIIVAGEEAFSPPTRLPASFTEGKL